ncbi:MAG: ferrochelatase [Thermostichales cyanobacterium SRBZ-1_bins_19]
MLHLGVAMEKQGVLLLNLGGPDTLADVRPFLYNLFADPELLRLPAPWLQQPLAWLIATTRAKKSQANYASLGGGSPLRPITEAQAQALQTELTNQGIPVRVYVAMRYWHPFARDVLQRIKADGIQRLVLLPLYPQYSFTTTGSSFRELRQLRQQDPDLQAMHWIWINSWYDQPDYVQAMAAAITTELEQFPHPEQVHVLFSAHGIPASYVTQAGDPYQQEVEGCVRLIWKQVGRANPHSLSYQSRVGAVKWLEPYTEDRIPALAAAGVKQLLVVPISFISDHIETLQEIDQEYRHLALSHGIQVFRRVPALNTHPRFITALSNLVRPHLTAPLPSVAAR